MRVEGFWSTERAIRVGVHRASQHLLAPVLAHPQLRVAFEGVRDEG